MNAHNNLRYSDGEQMIRDLANPKLSTATFIIGSPRSITFERVTKVVSGGICIGSWSKTDLKHFIESKLATATNDRS